MKTVLFFLLTILSFTGISFAQTPLVRSGQANTYTGGGLQDFSAMKFKPPTTVVGSLPAAAGGNTNQVYEITDGASGSDCTMGGGSTRVFCASTGSAWVALGGGGGGGASPAGSAGCVQLYLDATHFTCDTNFQWNAAIGPIGQLSLGTATTDPFGGAFDASLASAYIGAILVDTAAGSRYGEAINLNLNAPSSSDTNYTGLQASISILPADASHHSILVGSTANVVHNGSGQIYTLYGSTVDVENNGSGTVDVAYGFDSVILGAGFGIAYNYHAQDLAGVATNPYYSYYDSRGVGVCKEDAGFNSAGQVICRVYDNEFPKYTPGAPDYQRGVYGRFNTNVYELGSEAGGTGTVRDLRLLGPTVHIGTASNISSTTFTGAGVNDGVFNGTYTGATLTYCAIIDATGTPDTFKWGTNGGCDSGATGVAITGANQTLSSGVVIKFAATTGHTAADKWSAVATAATADGGLLRSGGYLSSDGSPGVTGATCSAWKNGLCTSN